MRFKERRTDHLYDVQRVESGFVIIRQAPPYERNIEKISIEEFVERFDESYVQQPS